MEILSLAKNVHLVQTAGERWQFILNLANGDLMLLAKTLWNVQMKMFALEEIQIILKENVWQGIKASFAVIVHLTIQRPNSLSVGCVQNV